MQLLVGFDDAAAGDGLLDEGAAGSSAGNRDVIAGLNADLKFRRGRSRTVAAEGAEGKIVSAGGHIDGDGGGTVVIRDTNRFAQA